MSDYCHKVVEFLKNINNLFNTKRLTSVNEEEENKLFSIKYLNHFENNLFLTSSGGDLYNVNLPCVVDSVNVMRQRYGKSAKDRERSNGSETHPVDSSRALTLTIV